MNVKKANKIMNIVYPLISIAVMVIVWVILYRSAGSEFIFPSLKSVLNKSIEYFGDAFFYRAAVNTLGRVILSFLISFIVACVLGVLSYLFLPVKKIIMPIIAVMRSAPTIAIMIILNLVAVKPKISPIIVSLTVIFPMLYSAVLASFNTVDPKWIEMAKVYKVGKFKQITEMYIPAIFPYIFEQCGAALSFNVKLTVSAEIIANTYASLGGILQTANVYIDIAGVMSITVITIVFAVILELIVKITLKLIGLKRKKHDRN